MKPELYGTVIHGTLRSQDLVPAFMRLLKALRKPTGISTIPREARNDESHPWWDSEDCAYFLNETLFDKLNECAPEGFYFGAHPGDGSDFGFWEVDDDD